MPDVHTHTTTRRFGRVIVATTLAVAMSLTLAKTLTARDDDRVRSCNNRTLGGDYGLVFSGTLLDQPTVGTAIRTYDGRGHFTQIDNEHSIFGTVTDRPAEGTYEVRTNCTGTMTAVLADGVIVSTFVIVGDGNEVKEAVMSPPPAFVTATQTRIH
ncbi:MAG: hypothetical protein ABJA98_34745 [Acidobacteriota bacterium]